MQTGITVRVVWDEEAEWWIATSDDVPGLATGAATLEQMSTKLQGVVPELLERNGVAVVGELLINIKAERTVAVAM